MEPWQGHARRSSRRGPSGCRRDRVPRIVGDERDGRVDEGPGGGAGDAAALAQPVGSGGCGGAETVGQRHDGRTQTAAGGERGTAPGERDSGDGFGFFAVRIPQDAPS